MKQLLSIEDLSGKTISKTLLSEPELWMKFTDNSFAVFDIEDRTEGFGHTKSAVVLSDWKKDGTNIELVNLEIISLSEHKKAIKDNELATDIRQQERDKEQQSQIEKLEKEQLKKLSEKYGK